MEESARTNTSCAGIDMSNNTGARNASGLYAAPSWLNGTYSSEIYGARVVELLADHAANHRSKPFYLYLPFQSVHMPNEAPEAMIAKYPATMKNTITISNSS